MSYRESFGVNRVYRRLGLGIAAVSVLLLSACQVNWVSDSGVSGGVSCPPIPTAPTATITFTCTGSVVPSAAPTTTTSTTTPATTTTASTTTTATSTPPSTSFPSPTTAGVSAGTVLTTHPTTTITVANTIVSNWHVTGDLVVKAGGVQIRNSQIDGQIEDDPMPYGSARMVVSDTTVGLSTGCVDDLGLGEHDYTATRVLIHGRGHGFQVSGNNVSVSDSFVQTCDSVNQHDDGMQIYCPAQYLPQPCQNINFNHNTLSVANTQNFTAPLFGGSPPGGSNGQIANSSFTNNLLWGGVYSIYLTGPNLTITGNRVATNRWTMTNGEVCEANTTGVNTPQGCSYAGWVYAPTEINNGNSSCSTAHWSDNVTVTKDSNWQVASVGSVLPCV